MLEHALAYLADEWSVFPVCSPVPSHAGRCQQHGPCKHPGKLPLVKWGVYQDRNPTPLEVKNWWRKWPTANIGLATGQTSDIVVLDLDGELAVATAEGYGYDYGPWVRTGRVGGRHLYFRYRSDAPTIFAKVGGIDFRGQGGFVLLPPSLHSTGNRYVWGEPIERGDPLPDLPRWVDSMGATTEHGVDRGPIDFGKLLTDGVPIGQRDQELFRAAAKLRGADVPYQLAVDLIERAAQVCQPPFDPLEARAKVDSAYSRYAPNPPPAPQLFAANGLQPINGQILQSVNGHVVDVATGEVLERIAPWRTLGALVNKALATSGQLVEGFLWEGKTHWCYSGPGAGKTLTWLAVLMHMAAGKPFCGLPVIQGPVLLIEEDSPDSVISEYVQMLADIYEFDLDSLPFWINVQRGIRITDDAGLATVRDMIAAAPQKPLVLALDACERIVPSDKFNSKEIDPLSRLCAQNLANGIANLVIDHTRKPITSSIEKADPVDMLYGGRAKSAISDVMTFFSGGIKDQALMTFTKFRGDVPPPLSIKFDGSIGFTIKQGKVQLSESERSVMRVLNNVFGHAVSSADLAADAKLGPSSVRRVLAKLIALGWVERDGDGRASAYRAIPGAPGVFGA